MRVLGQWATRLWKRGKKSRGTCEDTGWVTRLRKRGKKIKKRGVEGRVRVLGGLLGGWATRLRKRGKKKRRFEGDV